MRKNKRNAFQTAIDKRLAVELLSKGYGYQQIADEISSRNAYTISYQQVIKDLTGLRLEALAKAGRSMAELIDEEMQVLEFAIAEVKAAIEVGKRATVTKTVEHTDKHGVKTTIKTQYLNLNPAYIERIINAAARRSELCGVDAYLKHLDINAAIESLVSKGYVVSLPESI